MTRLLFHAAVAALLVAPAASCGLIDPDITNFDLTLPSKQFTVDTSRWDLEMGAALVSAPCDVNPSDPCVAGAAQFCDAEPPECSAVCDTTTSTCDLTLYASLYQEIDLRTEKPELQTIEDQPVLDVTIDAINFEISANTMNVDTPEMVVYAAPQTVMDPGDDRARRVGTVPAIGAGQVRTLTAIAFDADGKANLASFMSDYKTPFNIIVGTSLLLENGDPVPSGAMTVRVVVEAHAGL